MSIMLLGVNHKTCPVEIREKLSVSSKEEFLAMLKNDPVMEEVILLSTCNRSEFYFFSPKNDMTKENLQEYIFKKRGIQYEEFREHLYFMTDNDAIEHLFSVASGIDSMIIGEGQILGQTKEALRTARDTETTCTILSQLFKGAITCGKRARTETRIGTGASSISFAAVEFAKMIFGNLCGKTAMIIGAGKMGQLTAKQLAQQGLSQVVVANKTFEKAVEMANMFRGKAISFDRVEEYLVKTDIVISSTGAPHYVLHYDTVKRAILARKNKPLFLIDIAVPRDIEPTINKLPNVFLYDIDDLVKVVENNLEERKEEIGKVKHIIREEKDKFISWYRTREVVPIIKSIKEKAEVIRNDELSKALKKLSHLSDNDQSLIEQATKKIINKLLHKTIIKLKECSTNGRAAKSTAELISELFDIQKTEGE